MSEEFLKKINNLYDEFIDKFDYPHVLAEEIHEFTIDMMVNCLGKFSKVDIIPTMSQFSRTYGFKLFYISNGKTEMINNTYGKYNTKHEALFAGIELVMKLTDDNVIKKIAEE